MTYSFKPCILKVLLSDPSNPSPQLFYLSTSLGVLLVVDLSKLCLDLQTFVNELIWQLTSLMQIVYTSNDLCIVLYSAYLYDLLNDVSKDLMFFFQIWRRSNRLSLVLHRLMYDSHLLINVLYCWILVINHSLHFPYDPISVYHLFL